MKVLIKNATIHAPGSSYHDSVQDIFIENGIVKSISKSIDLQADTIVSHQDLHVSGGWVDCFANFCDPGGEYKETLDTGANAAAAGGFTDVMVIPNTDPAISGKSQVEYIIRKSRLLPVTIHPVGSITKDVKGTELSEMYDMFHSGAIAFSDGVKPVQQAGVFQKALEYLLSINGVAIQLPDDKSIGTYGLMNEGRISTLCGLAGKPALSEELMILRDIELARYTGSRVHFTGISTEKSLKLIESAKLEGLSVTCSVTPYHLYFSDEDLTAYDTNLKVNPPLRTPTDREALREGVRTATVDFIASHHEPQDYDHKVCEFEYAESGMEGLESVFGAARVCGISTERFLEMQVHTIRNIFNLPLPQIEEGSKACFTLFTPDEEYIFDENDVRSKCRNNAFLGKKLKGRAIGIINEEKLFLSPDYFL